MKKNPTMTLALAISTVLAAQTQGVVIQFDMGHNTQTTTATGWNNVTGGNGAIPNNVTDAVDSTGAATTIDLTYAEFNGSDSGVAGTARNYAGPYPAAVSGQDANALLDVIFSRDSPVQFTLGDLDSALTYDILIYGSTNRDGLSQYTVTGAGAAQVQTLTTNGNSNDVALFTGIAPNGTNEIVIDMISDNTTDPNITRGFAVINTLVVTSVPAVPEPSSALLLGMGALGLVVRRRH